MNTNMQPLSNIELFIVTTDAVNNWKKKNCKYCFINNILSYKRMKKKRVIEVSKSLIWKLYK